MCGIAGRFNRDRSWNVSPDEVRAMCDRIVHRGPDDQGQFTSGSVGLGMRRLSIIDVAGGHQPMTTEDGRCTIVFNGEIYNYRQLRKDLEGKGHRFRTASDTECVLHSYVEQGVECVESLNGMFAIAIWDEQLQRLFLARDRLGIKPLYIADDGRSLRFASEIKALLGDRQIPRELDLEALGYYLRYGYVGAPATLLRHIRKLPAAHCLVADRHSTTLSRYWKLDYETDPAPEEDQADRLREALRCSVERELVSDVPLGAFLSGGLDSSSIVELMTELTGGPVNTYAIGFGEADRFHSELGDARRMAHRCQTNHHEILAEPDAASLVPRLVSHLDEPLSDSSFIVTYLVARLARETVTVILSGVGGDELFGGYRRYLGQSLGAYYDWVPRPARQILGAGLSRLPVDRGSAAGNYARLARAFVTAHELPAFERYDATVRMVDEPLLNRLTAGGMSAASELGEQRRAFFNAPSSPDAVTRMMHLDLNTSLPESLLLLTDKMTMATSVEARVPFLDHTLVEFSARIPPSRKIKGTHLRYIQKRSMEGHLPPETLRKKKRGFGCPVGAWFRGDLRELLRDALSPARVARRGLLEATVVEELMDAHEARREDRTDLLLGLLTFELWAGECLDA